MDLFDAKLIPLKEENLIFSDEIEDDRTNTSLSLNDYDWAEYILSTRFTTNICGQLKVQFQHVLTTTSYMTVTQVFDDYVVYYEYEYDTNIFAKYITKYLEKHLVQWKPDNKYAFNGEEVVLEFYNEVLEKGTLKDKVGTDIDVPKYLSWKVNEEELFRINKIKKIQNSN